MPKPEIAALPFRSRSFIGVAPTMPNDAQGSQGTSALPQRPDGERHRRDDEPVSHHRRGDAARAPAQVGEEEPADPEPCERDDDAQRHHRRTAHDAAFGYGAATDYQV